LIGFCGLQRLNPRLYRFDQGFKVAAFAGGEGIIGNNDLVARLYLVRVRAGFAEFAFTGSS